MINTHKLFDYDTERLEYLFEQLEENNNITLIVDYETAKVISEDYQYREDEFSEEFYIDLDSEKDVYYVSKIGNEAFFIDDMYGNNQQYLDCEDNVIIVLDEIVCEDDNILSYLQADSELIVVEYEEKEDCCNDCCDNCEGCIEVEEIYEDDTDEVDEYIEEEIKSFMEFLKENEDNEEFCFHCALKIFAEFVYNTAFVDGRNTIALSLSDLMHDIINKE